MVLPPTRRRRGEGRIEMAGRSRTLLILVIVALLLTLATFVLTEPARAPQGDGALRWWLATSG